MRQTSLPGTPWRRLDLDVTREDIFAKLRSQGLAALHDFIVEREPDSMLLKFK